MQLFSSQNSLDQDCQTLLKEAIENYYKSFNGYLKNVLTREILIDKLISDAKAEAVKYKMSEKCDFNLRKKTVPKILALLSLVHSLGFSGFLEKTKTKQFQLIKDIDSAKFLLQPQSVQILSIMRILALDNKESLSIPNHLFEILTGQGKSWVLALLAGFFALIGYKVTVACYSDYLSNRDKAYFEKFLEPFEFNQTVDYCTFATMCDRKISPSNKVFKHFYLSIDKRCIIFLFNELDIPTLSITVR